MVWEVAETSEGEGEEGEGGELGDEGFGGGDADFRAGEQFEGGVGFAGERAGGMVGEGERESALAAGFAEGG